MPTLLSPNGSSFSLRIDSYTYPSPTAPKVDDDWTANLLNITAVASDGQREWVLSGEWCTTWELGRLTFWLDAVAWGNFNLFCTCGVEPYPDFDVDVSSPLGPRVTVTTAQHSPSGGYDEITLDLGYDPAALREFAAQLEEELWRFPIRVVESAGTASAWIGTLEEYARTDGLRLAAQRQDRHLPRHGSKPAGR